MTADRPVGAVLIVGGGVAGCALAAGLTAAGVDVEIVERATTWRHAGYGLTLWPDGLAALDRLGIDPEAVGTPVRRWTLRDGTGRTLADVPLGGDATPLTAVHRGELCRILRERAAGVPVTMGTTVDEIVPDGDRVRVRLSTGRWREADVVVGADGVDSRVRRLVFDNWTLTDTGTAVWSFWISDERDLPDGFTELWAHDGSALLTAPLAGRRMASVAARTDLAAGQDPLRRLRRLARWWPPPFDDLTADVDPDEVYFDRLRQVRAPYWVRGRVVLCGDAAHAVHPIVGVGATLALQDATVLAAGLTHRPGMALADYQATRSRPATAARLMAGAARAVTFTRSRPLTVARDWLVRAIPLGRLLRLAGRPPT